MEQNSLGVSREALPEGRQREPRALAPVQPCLPGARESEAARPMAGQDVLQEDLVASRDCEQPSGRECLLWGCTSGSILARRHLLPVSLLGFVARYLGVWSRELG